MTSYIFKSIRKTRAFAAYLVLALLLAFDIDAFFEESGFGYLVYIALYFCQIVIFIHILNTTSRLSSLAILDITQGLIWYLKTCLDALATSTIVLAILAIPVAIIASFFSWQFKGLAELGNWSHILGRFGALLIILLVMLFELSLAVIFSRAWLVKKPIRENTFVSLRWILENYRELKKLSRIMFLVSSVFVLSLVVKRFSPYTDLVLTFELGAGVCQAFAHIWAISWLLEFKSQSLQQTQPAAAEP